MKVLDEKKIEQYVESAKSILEGYFGLRILVEREPGSGKKFATFEFHMLSPKGHRMGYTTIMFSADRKPSVFGSRSGVFMAIHHGDKEDHLRILEEMFKFKHPELKSAEYDL